MQYLHVPPIQAAVKDGFPLGPTVQKVETVRRELGALRFSTPRCFYLKPRVS